MQWTPHQAQNCDLQGELRRQPWKLVAANEVGWLVEHAIGFGLGWCFREQLTRHRHSHTMVGQDNGSTLERHEATEVTRRPCELLQHMVAEILSRALMARSDSAQEEKKAAGACAAALRRPRPPCGDEADAPGGWQDRAAGHPGQRGHAATGPSNAARCGRAWQRRQQ